MPQLAPVTLSAEQFNQLATKDYLDKNLATKDDLKSFATKDYLDKNFATKDYLDKNFATKDYLDKNFATKDYLDNSFATKDDLKNFAREMESRFNLLDYKIDTTFAHMDKNLKETCLDHEIRIKKLETKAYF